MPSLRLTPSNTSKTLPLAGTALQRYYKFLNDKKKRNSALDNTTDTVDIFNKGMQNDTATLQNTISFNKDSKFLETRNFRGKQMGEKATP